jgi:type IV pilus assembly protein PilP
VKRLNVWLWMGWVAALLGLAGCGNSEQEELQVWMTAERNAIRPQVKPIPEPTKFIPQIYTADQMMPPFSGEKLASVIGGGSKVPAAVNSSLIDPELNRRRQPLEAYPLDTMTMVGSILMQGQLVALVKVSNLLYQVRPGSYLGQNYGRVNGVTETEITLREIVQDSAGEWIERPAALKLVEDATK